MHTLNNGIHGAHQLSKFCNRDFVCRIAHIERLRKSALPGSKQAEHKVHRIVHRGKAAFRNTSIYKF